MSVPVSLRKALQEVKKVAERPSDVGRFAKGILPLLELGVEELESRSVIRPARGTGKIEYIVAMTEQGEALTERRLSGQSKPFRCPKHIYETLAAVLENSDRALAMDEIVLATEKRIGVRPADHQVRVALRFWTHATPPLVMRQRARYQPIGDSLVALAAKLWGQLR